MTYSEVVALLSSHLVPKETEGQQMIPLLEKFVNLDSMVEEDFSRAPPLLDE